MVCCLSFSVPGVVHLSLLIVQFAETGVILFFKQKTAYEMRISDWSSDVCSSDLGRSTGETCCRRHSSAIGQRHLWHRAPPVFPRRRSAARSVELGRASCRERVCQYV